MKLYYNKEKPTEILSPNASSLLKFMINMETNKKYINLKQCARILYILNQSIVVWNDENYKEFIGKLPQEISSFYMTINSNKNGKFTVINRNNVKTLKNDFNFLFKLFSNIISLMIMDGKKKLFIKE